MYKTIYDFKGKPTGIQNDNMSIPLEQLNRDFRKFLAWNKKQKKPLDYETPIDVVKPVVEKTEVEKLKDLLVEKSILSETDIDSLKSI